MRAVPEKIRSGLVELRTRSGLAYVRPSLAERVYLLWTFRNFRRLPKEVLNRRQRQLIEKLCQTAIVSQRVPVARTSLIGTVENVEVLPERKPEAPADAVKVVTMNLAGTSAFTTRAVGFEARTVPTHSDALSIPARRRSSQNAFGRFRQQLADIQSISRSKAEPLHRDAIQKLDAVRRGAKENRLWLAGTLLACCSMLLLGAPFFSRKLRPAPSVTMSQDPAGVRQHSSGSIPVGSDTHSIVPPSTPAKHLRVPTTPEQPTPIVSTILRENTRRPEIALPRPAVVSANLTPVPRLRIAGPPLSGFTYPTSPNATLTGKVNLKAVIAPDGSVTSVDVVSGNHALAGAAVKAVQHWRYGSQEVNGNAAEAETNIVISFAGEDAVSISFPQ